MYKKSAAKQAKIDNGNQVIKKNYKTLATIIMSFGINEFISAKEMILPSIFENSHNFQRYLSGKVMTDNEKYQYAALQNLRSMFYNTGYDLNIKFRESLTLLSISDMTPSKKSIPIKKLNVKDPSKVVLKKSVSFA